MGGSFGEQQGLGSDPAQPFNLQGVPQAEPQCSSHTQAAAGAALSTTQEKPSANPLVGQEEKLIQEDIPWTASLGRAEQCCCRCLAGTELAQSWAHTPQLKAF